MPTLGIGCILLQKAPSCDAEWKIVQAGSRFFTESRYAVVELECLAVAWAIKKCSLFLDGIDHFTVITDHNPAYLTSLPRHVTPRVTVKLKPQSNPRKKMISASWTGKSVDWNKLSRALIQYRNTPCRKDGQSPAQKLFGHPVQDSIPAHRRSFALEWQKSANEVEKAAHSTEEKAQAAYNQHAHDLTDLKRQSSCSTKFFKQPLGHIWNYHIDWTTPPILHKNTRTSAEQALHAQKTASLHWSSR